MRLMRALVFVLLAVNAIEFSATDAQGADPPGKQLATLFSDSWEFVLREDPLFATSTGDARYNDKLPRETLADQARRLQAERTFLDRLQKIPRDQLTPAEQVNYDVFARLKRDAIAEFEFQANLMPITNRSGFHVSFPELPLEMPLATVNDYENYIARLSAFSQYVDDNIELMRAGIKQGMVLPSISMVDFDKALRPQIVDDPTASLLYKPFATYPDAVAPAERARLTEAGRTAIVAGVVRGYLKLLDFLDKEYVPACREADRRPAPCHAGANTIATGCASSRRSTSTRNKCTTPARPKCAASRLKWKP